MNADRRDRFQDFATPRFFQAAHNRHVYVNILSTVVDYQGCRPAGPGPLEKPIPDEQIGTGQGRNLTSVFIEPASPRATEPDESELNSANSMWSVSGRLIPCM